MANVRVVDTKTVHKLEPGKTIHILWNNTAPANAVWSAHAVPRGTGRTAAGFAQDTSLEVTRLWQVVEKKPFPQSQTVDVEVEHEIHYKIKNVGKKKASFVVSLSAVS